MASGRFSLALLAATLVAVTTACASPIPSTTPPPRLPVPSGPSDVAVAGQTTRFAPYVDATLTDVPLAAMSDTAGVNDAVLAFVLATDGGCTPSWGGNRAIDDPKLVAAAAQLRSRGGEITVATGGADGEYLENTCGSADELRGAYETALDAVGATSLDVDIESDVPVDQVIEALVGLQQARGTKVMLTLRVHGQKDGLEPIAMDLVRAADEQGLDVTVNAMVMNFPAQGAWKDAMVEATDAVTGQLAGVWTDLDKAGVARRSGVTLMIGRTDVGTVTTLDDARGVAEAVHQRGLGFMSMWSLGRDNGGCPGAGEARFDCSGVEQSPFGFAKEIRTALDG